MAATFIQIQIDSARVIHETVDDETLIIDSVTGIYYLLGGSGAEVWRLISQGTDGASLIDQVAQQFTTPIAEIEVAIQQFLHELQEANLITITASQTPITAQVIETAMGQPRQPTAAFITPELHIFTDMHHLLLIDPIHEVAETGWPFTPTNTAMPEKMRNGY